MIIFLCSNCNCDEEEDKSLYIEPKPSISREKAIKTKTHSTMRTGINTLSFTNDNDTQFAIIDYPYKMSSPQTNNIMNVLNVPHIQKEIPLSTVPKASSNDELNDTLVDYFSDQEHSKDNSCAYCEEIYREAYSKGYIIKEKQCIYCNRMINQEHFDSLIKKGTIKNENEELIKARSANRMNIVKDTKRMQPQIKVPILSINKLSTMIKHNKKQKTKSMIKFRRMKTEENFRVKNKYV